MNEQYNEPEAHAEPDGMAGRRPQDSTQANPQATPPGMGHSDTVHPPAGSFTEGLLADAMRLPEGEWTTSQLQDEQIGTPWHEQQSNPESGAATSEHAGTQTDTMGHLLDLHLPLTIELGRTDMSVADILELNQGSIIELDKLAGEPVDVLINHQPVAKGEVVVIDERFGIRITQLVKPGDRISSMSLQ